MEKYVFVKEGDEILTIRVSEHMYGEIMRLPVISEKTVAESCACAKTEEVVQTDVLQEDEMSMGSDVEVNSIFVKDRDFFRKIEFKCIRWVEACGSYSCLNLNDEPKLMLSFNLRELLVHLPHRVFIRVHRSYVVNINFIDSFIGNTLYIGKNQIPMSKQHKRCVINRLNILGNVKG